jgi:hypothetical protein
VKKICDKCGHRHEETEPCNKPKVEPGTKAERHLKFAREVLNTIANNEILNLADVRAEAYFALKQMDDDRD